MNEEKQGKTGNNQGDRENSRSPFYLYPSFQEEES